ncbi:MAG: hypothetical protein Kow0062_09910 [Acidobacteriota bacterium]
MSVRASLICASLLTVTFVTCSEGGGSGTSGSEHPNRDQAGAVLVDEQGLGAQGYDLVAYFVDGHAVRGSEKYTTSFEGVTYRFASADHLALFREHPRRYLPAFGGYCAFAVAAKNAKVVPNPETFRIQDGRLLLFFNGPYQNQVVDTSAMWDENPRELLAQADQHWQALERTERDQ